MLNVRTATILLIITGAALVANSEWGASLAVDMFRTESVRQAIKNERELSDNLEVVNREIQRRITIKEELIKELIAGRTTLAAVTEKFQTLNQSRPEYIIVIRRTFPGENDEERTARNVIGYVEGELAVYSLEIRIEVLDRLQTELRTLPYAQSTDK